MCLITDVRLMIAEESISSVSPESHNGILNISESIRHHKKSPKSTPCLLTWVLHSVSIKAPSLFLVFVHFFPFQPASEVSVLTTVSR